MPRGVDLVEAVPFVELAVDEIGGGVRDAHGVGLTVMGALAQRVAWRAALDEQRGARALADRGGEGVAVLAPAEGGVDDRSARARQLAARPLSKLTVEVCGRS